MKKHLARFLKVSLVAISFLFAQNTLADDQSTAFTEGALAVGGLAGLAGIGLLLGHHHGNTDSAKPAPTPTPSGNFQWQPTAGPYGSNRINYLLTVPSTNNTNILLGVRKYMADDMGVFVSHDNGANWTVSLLGHRILVLAADADGSHIYAGTQSDGVFISQDGGLTWTAPATQPTTVSIQDIIVNNNSSQHEVYLANGSQIFHSTDHGQTWTQQTVPEVDHPSFKKFAIDYYSIPEKIYILGSKIESSQTKYDVLEFNNTTGNWESTGLNTTDEPYSSLTTKTFVAFHGGLYLGLKHGIHVYASVDNKNEWSWSIVRLDEPTGRAIRVLYPDLGNNRIYAVGGPTGNKITYCDSDGINPCDGDDGWSGHDSTSSTYAVIDMASSGSGAATKLYAAAYHGIYSSSGNNVWTIDTSMPEKETATIVFNSGSDCFFAASPPAGLWANCLQNNGWYNIDDHITAIKVISKPIFQGNQGVYLNAESRLYTSADAGLNWSAITDTQITGFNKYLNNAIVADDTKVYTSFSTFAVTTPNDKTNFSFPNLNHNLSPSPFIRQLYSSTNGLSWDLVTPLQTYGVYALATNLSKTALYASTYSEHEPDSLQLGDIWRSTDHGGTWQAAGIQSSFNVTIPKIAIDTQNGNDIVYAYFNAVANDGQQGLFHSTDFSHWTEIKFDGDSIPYTPNNIVVDPLNHYVYILLSSDIYFYDGASVGGVKLQKPTGVFSIKNIFVNPFNGDLYLVPGAGTHNLYRSIDHGQNWNLISQFDSIPISDMDFDATTGNVYVATAKNGFYVSTDQGTTWTQQNTGLTNLYMSYIGVNAGAVYATTSAGVLFKGTANQASQSASK